MQKKRGRPPKMVDISIGEMKPMNTTELTVDSGVHKVDIQPSVHHVVRYLTPNALQADGVNVFSGWELDANISRFVDSGYRLAYTQFTGKTPEGYLEMLYVLVKE